MAHVITSALTSSEPANGKLGTVHVEDTGLSIEKEKELKELKIAEDLGAPDVYIDAETDSSWYHWVGHIWVKPLRFENRTGCYVIALKSDEHTENPGAIHTLWMGEQSEILFTVMGSIEFFHDDNTLRETMDGFSFWRMYVEQCEKKGIEPNRRLWY